MKKTDKREYVKPRLYHKVIKDIEQTIDKIIKDDRSIDRSFWTDHIKFSDVVLMDPMTTQDPDKNMKELVESSSIYLISMLILQVALFHRVVREGPMEFMLYPKKHLPYFMRQMDSKGKEKDFYDLNSLKLLKHFYDKEDKTLNEWMKD